jgi:hypothetical protein
MMGVVALPYHQVRRVGATGTAKLDCTTGNMIVTLYHWTRNKGVSTQVKQKHLRWDRCHSAHHAI